MPAMPLKDDFGSTGAAEPEQIEETGIKKVLVIGLTVTINEAVVAH